MSRLFQMSHLFSVAFLVLAGLMIFLGRKQI